MSETTPSVEKVLLCGTDSPQPGTAPYYVGYSDMVDGYRHAWTETDRFGRKKIRRGRTANHPADSRCPECHLPPTQDGPR